MGEGRKRGPERQPKTEILGLHLESWLYVSVRCSKLKNDFLLRTVFYTLFKAPSLDLASLISLHHILRLVLLIWTWTGVRAYSKSRQVDSPSPSSGGRDGLRKTFAVWSLVFSLFEILSHNYLSHSSGILYLCATLHRVGGYGVGERNRSLSRLKVSVFQNSTYPSPEFQNFLHTSLTFLPSGLQSSVKKEVWKKAMWFNAFRNVSKWRIVPQPSQK